MARLPKSDPAHPLTMAGGSRWLPPLRAALSRPGIQLWLLTAAVAALHFGHWWLSRGNPYLAFRVGDELQYDTWARAILEGKPWNDGVFVTGPLYPYFLAAVYRIAGDAISTVTLVNAALGTCTAALTWHATMNMTRRPSAAAIAMILEGFCSAPLFYESSPDKTAFVLLLAAVAIHQVTRAFASPSPYRWLAAGLAIGVAGLGHTLLLLIAPAAALAYVLAEGLSRRSLSAVGELALASLVAVSPATLHNAIRGGEFALVCTNGGLTLYIANQAGNTTGLYTSPPFSKAEYASEAAGFKAEAERRLSRTLTHGEASSYWTRQSLLEMRARPALAAQRIAKRIWWSFGKEELADTRTYEFYLPQLPFVRLLPWGFGLVSALGLWGFLVRARPSRAWAPLAVLVVLYAGALGLFLVYGRYRLPLIIPLAIAAGAAISSAADALASRTWRRLLMEAGLLAACGAFVFHPISTGAPVSFLPDYLSQGNRYLKAGMTGLALDEYEKAVTVRPGSHPAMPRLAIEVARMRLALGDRERAAATLRAALAWRPEDPDLSAALAGLTGAAR